jgi:Tol biopolymer transport system component
MSPDGRWIVFQAYRDADAHGEQDLYAIERLEYGWSDPILLPEPINSPANDGYPSFSPDGRHFFFATDRSSRGGWYDIWWVDSSALGLESSGARVE